jgi:hypothetical protein
MHRLNQFNPWDLKKSSSSILPVPSPEATPTGGVVIIECFGGDPEIDLDETLKSKD